MDPCVYRLRQGKAHAYYSPGRYSVCITRTQHEKLFGACPNNVCVPPKALGCGVWGCAYPHPDPAKVVKITRDESDAMGTILAQQRGVPNTVDVHAVFRLTSPIIWRTFARPGPYALKPFWDMRRPYAMVVERLAPLDKHWTRRVNCAEKLLYFALRSRGPQGLMLTKSEVKRLRKCCPADAEQQSCRRGIFDITRTYLGLARAGMPWADMSRPNIGVDRRGRWKALDLGVGPTRDDRDEIEALAGARGTRKARRRRYG
jgi:hypothetical protein